jgi:hypothetical protein
MQNKVYMFYAISEKGRTGTRVSRGGAGDTGEGMPDIHGILFATRLYATKLKRHLHSADLELLRALLSA